LYVEYTHAGGGRGEGRIQQSLSQIYVAHRYRATKEGKEGLEESAVRWMGGIDMRMTLIRVWNNEMR
jgi:hypothetical protein